MFGSTTTATSIRARETASRIVAANEWIMAGIRAGSIEALHEAAQRNNTNPSPIQKGIMGERTFTFRIEGVPIALSARSGTIFPNDPAINLDVMGEGYGDLWWTFIMFSEKMKADISIMKKSSSIGALTLPVKEILMKEKGFFCTDDFINSLLNKSHK
ncbi:hypothetical protein [Zavarzinia aquatilis]|uniref:hypothetical protein n=1 Tax=Zavarzinia aquatilis TaxID=2211142 RepID=UPI0010581139|nr:hypothetical protein [Zavarzinia aquatilis]